MRKTALFLALILMITPMLSACGSASDQSTVNVPKAEPAEVHEFTLDSLPELDYGKKEFGIYGVDASMSFLIAEEENGDIVNDAIFQRNIAIEEKYNLDFLMYQFEKAGGAGAQAIRNFVLSGDTTYHVYQSFQHQGMPGMILNDYFVDWNEMEHVHYDKPYWNTNIARDINFGGKVYTMAGDLSLITYNSTNCIAFNKKLFDDLGIDYPYQDVYDKQWTVDKFIEIVKQGYADLNGDSMIDLEGDDRLGFAGWSYEMNYALYVGMGGKTIVNDENNMPVLAMNSERTVKIFDKIIEIFDGKNSFMNQKDWNIDKKMFSAGKLLMDDQFLPVLSSNRDSEFDIGMLPYPMLDAEQGEYRSRAANIAHLSYVPTTNKELEETGIILEAMSIESHNRIRPAYYDITLNLKSARDEETKDMVELIMQTSSYLYEGFMTVAFIKQVADTQTNTFSSWYATMERGFQRQLKKMTEFYGQ